MSADPDRLARLEAIAARKRRKPYVAKTKLLPNARAPFLDDPSVETRPSVPVKPPEAAGAGKTKVLELPWAEFLFDPEAAARREAERKAREGGGGPGGSATP